MVVPKKPKVDTASAPQKLTPKEATIVSPPALTHAQIPKETIKEKEKKILCEVVLVKEILK
jgi:hypothetical protein